MLKQVDLAIMHTYTHIQLLLLVFLSLLTRRPKVIEGAQRRHICMYFFHTTSHKMQHAGNLRLCYSSETFQSMILLFHYIYIILGRQVQSEIHLFFRNHMILFFKISYDSSQMKKLDIQKLLPCADCRNNFHYLVFVISCPVF